MPSSHSMTLSGAWNSWKTSRSTNRSETLPPTKYAGAIVSCHSKFTVHGFVSAYLSICHCMSLYVSLYVPLSVTVCLSLSREIYIYIYTSLYVSLYFTVCLFICHCPSIYMSMYVSLRKIQSVLGPCKMYLGIPGIDKWEGANCLENIDER